jgi:type I site-specific restriction-modification system R (restriction) subunit
MSKVGQIERITQNRVVKLFQNRLGYDYLGNRQDRPDNKNIEEAWLRPFLVRQGHTESVIVRAIHELNKVAGDQTKSFYDINKELYSLLRYGVKVKPDIGENTVTVWLVDWKNPLANHFGIAEEVSVKGTNNKRPDIVIYVNGIALGILELKRSTVSVAEGIRQNLDNQKADFIRPFFHTMQLVMAGNDTEGLRYGTIETPEKYYLTWKEDTGSGGGNGGTGSKLATGGGSGGGVGVGVRGTSITAAPIIVATTTTTTAAEPEAMAAEVEGNDDTTATTSTSAPAKASAAPSNSTANANAAAVVATGSSSIIGSVSNSANTGGRGNSGVSSGNSTNSSVSKLDRLDQELIYLCQKERLLEIIHDFVAFDAGTKKLCRPNQYFGVRAAQESIRKQEGGIIWHTQGSGKSLTMVWLARWIRENVQDTRVLIITDRSELDDQIEKVFEGVKETIYRTKSGQDLIAKLSATAPWLICSLVHKFGKDTKDSKDKGKSNSKSKGQQPPGQAQSPTAPAATAATLGATAPATAAAATAVTTTTGAIGQGQAQGQAQAQVQGQAQEEEEASAIAIGQFIADVKNNVPAGFRAQGNFIVFVDECHRTQSGKLHEAMKEILPDALFIGFTGTPLLKSDKQRSIEIFGKYIHTYKFDEAVRDGVVLDLRYEARDIEQRISSPKRIDQWFDAKTKNLTDRATAQLKQKWGTMQKVLSSQSRLEVIVADILLDMETKPRLMEGGKGNAILVSGSIYQACKFYELFLDANFDKCAIVTSYKPNISDTKGETTGEGLTERLKQYDIYNKMLGGKDPEDFEREVKKKFVDEPGQMKLLIVVDKLLTGFDAPSATYLYIDKHMRDHGLFQAICRVNRLDGEDKEYGYIIDYKDLFKSLEHSIQDYTSGALDGYEPEDVKGLLTDRLSQARQHLDEVREAVKALCEPVALPRNTADYLHYFCAAEADTTTSDKHKAALQDNEPKRVALYKLVSALMRAYTSLANELEEAGYTAAESAAIKKEVEYYDKVSTEVKMGSGDYIDLKLYEPAMRYMLDKYIQAEDSNKVSAFEDISLIELIVERGEANTAISRLPAGIAANQEAMAVTIENNLRRLVIDERPLNPKYYDKMSELLDILIQERKQKALDYETYLAQIVELAKAVKNPGGVGGVGGNSKYPSSLGTPGLRALYDNLNEDEQLALAIHSEIQRTKKDDWRGNRIKGREVLNAIRTHLNSDARQGQFGYKDETVANQIFELVKSQHEY